MPGLAQGPRSRHRRGSPAHRPQGFTLVELITVMILTGILAFAIVPVFNNRTFDERGFSDAVRAALQHARHVAVASRRHVCATVAAGNGPTATVALTMDTTRPESVSTVTCSVSAPVALPSPGRGCAASNQVCAPAGVTLAVSGGNPVIFDPLGRSTAATTVTIGGGLSIRVETETGYVR